jgi:septal ring factor EnvC (AmiA/AmiB activator)
MTKILLLLCYISAFACALSAQTRSQLEAERQKINNQLQQTNKKLVNVQQTKKKTNAELKTLSQKVKAREQSVTAIAKTVLTIEQTIQQKDLIARALAADVDSIAAAYQHTALLLYRYQRSTPENLAIFSPEYWQSYFRTQQYLAYLENLRLQQLYLLAATQASLEKRLANLKTEKASKDQVLRKELTEKETLTTRLNTQDKLVKQLSAQETTLRNQLAQAQKSKNQLNSKIESVIRQEITAAKSQARTYTTIASNPANPTSPTVSTLPVQNEVQINKNFAASRGRLSAPVRGTVVSDYGVRPHPDLPLVMVENNGIDIKTVANAAVSSIYDGVVVSVFAIPSMGNAVMIKHGDFYTTYSGLTNIQVKRGSIVRANQSIGSVGKDAATNTYLLHFELWRNKQKENPRHWIKI